MDDDGRTLAMIREVVALGRAHLNRPHSPTGDPDAQHALTEAMTATGSDGRPTPIDGAVRRLLAPRTRFFDQLVAGAPGAGITQVVNLGAGYDDRALRFRHPDVQFFDLDLPPVIQDKTRRLRLHGVDTTNLTLVATDFRRDDVAATLGRGGHDDERPTMFLAEHLAVFLAPTDVLQLLTTLTRRAAPTSLLALTAEVHPAGVDSAELCRAIDEYVFTGASPLRTVLPLEDWNALLRNAHWRVDDSRTGPVDHFPVPLGEDAVPVRVQTHFLTARAADR
jgi:methyltransferase (TIGR00027 family)